MSDETKTVTLVYLGVREGDDQPRLHAWAEVTVPNDGQPLPDSARRRLYGKDKKKFNNIAPASPGAIYTFEQGKSPDSIVSDSGRFQGHWKNGFQVQAWQAESRAIDYAIDLKAKEKKENKQRRDLEPLEPIAEAYSRLVGPQKAILLGEVIRFITTYRPSRKKEEDYT